jgi:hypothetical protein
LIIFDDPNPIVNCLSDNIYLYDETGSILLNYCEKKTENNILFLSHSSKSLYVECRYGGLNYGIFSVSFKWHIFDVSSDIPSFTQTPQTESFVTLPPTIPPFTQTPQMPTFTMPPAVTLPTVSINLPKSKLVSQIN